MSVTPDPDTIILIQREPGEPDCSVCENVAPKQKCNPRRLELKDPTNTSVEFTCPRPQDVFSVNINRDIGMKVKKEFDIHILFRIYCQCRPEVFSVKDLWQ